MQATWRLRYGTQAMALNFPNPSRSYDATRRAVWFWGHDSAMEASFFVNEDALKRIQPDMRFCAIDPIMHKSDRIERALAIVKIKAD